jgi:hypothetical protein
VFFFGPTKLIYRFRHGPAKPATPGYRKIGDIGKSDVFLRRDDEVSAKKNDEFGYLITKHATV